jgi:hypothetical protein
MSMTFHCIELNLSKCNGIRVVSIKKDINFNSSLPHCHGWVAGSVVRKLTKTKIKYMRPICQWCPQPRDIRTALATVRFTPHPCHVSADCCNGDTRTRNTKYNMKQELELRHILPYVARYDLIKVAVCVFPATASNVWTVPTSVICLRSGPCSISRHI